MSMHFSIQFTFKKCLINSKIGIVCKLSILFHFFPRHKTYSFFVSCFSSPKTVVEIYRHFFVILVLGAKCKRTYRAKYALTETICVDVTDSSFALKP